MSEGSENPSAPDVEAVEIEFWDSIKNSTLASEYEAYLDQYPEGNFASLARVRVQAIAEHSTAIRDPRDTEIELAFWDTVRSSGKPALIQTYLDKYPDGEFSLLARVLMAESSGP